MLTAALLATGNATAQEQEHIVYHSCDFTDGIPAVCYPSCEDQMGTAQIVRNACVRHENVITGASAGCAIPFGLKLIEALKGAEEAMRIADQIVIR